MEFYKFLSHVCYAVSSSAGDLLIRTQDQAPSPLQLFRPLLLPELKNITDISMRKILWTKLKIKHFYWCKNLFHDLLWEDKFTFCDSPSPDSPHSPLHLLSELSSLKETTSLLQGKEIKKVRDNGEQTPETCHQTEKYKDHDGQLLRLKTAACKWSLAQLMCFVTSSISFLFICFCFNNQTSIKGVVMWCGNALVGYFISF